MNSNREWSLTPFQKNLIKRVDNLDIKKEEILSIFLVNSVILISQQNSFIHCVLNMNSNLIMIKFLLLIASLILIHVWLHLSVKNWFNKEAKVIFI